MLISTVMFISWLMRLKSLITCLAVIGSRAATGSSARMMVGFWFSVRAE